jgi:ribonucleotide monophosphatase NagD (HAD superfamily)
MKYKPLNDGLKSIFKEYDVFLIELWGVIHNGINLHQSAMEVLKKLKINDKEFFLVSNAPRPRNSVANFLRTLKMNEEYFGHIYTSGDAALEALKFKKFGNKFFHIGPPRDFDLFDEYGDNLDYYNSFLKNYINKKLICTNPDLVVHRGNKEEYCAGSVAKEFENLGGKVIYFGKPYPEIYRNCVKEKKKVLAIGDNLNTDIKGANMMNYHCLFILNGIHKNLFASNNNLKLEETLKKFNLNINYYQNQLKW